MVLFVLVKFLFILFRSHNQETLRADRIPRVVVILPVREWEKKLLDHRQPLFADEILPITFASV